MTWRWLEGVYLGTRFQSNEHIVALEDGRVVKARSVQALPEERRWNSERALGVQGKPWRPMGTVQRGACEDQEPPRRREEAAGEDAPPVTRNMPVQQQHLDKFGYTAGCLKCRMMRTGDHSRPSQGHSQMRRTMIREAAAGDTEFRQQAMAGQARTGGGEESHRTASDQRQGTEGEETTTRRGNEETTARRQGTETRNDEEQARRTETRNDEEQARKKSRAVNREEEDTRSNGGGDEERRVQRREAQQSAEARGSAEVAP